MAEWSKAHAWKACRRVTVSRVRIPVDPPSASPDITAPHNTLNYSVVSVRYKRLSYLMHWLWPQYQRSWRLYSEAHLARVGFPCSWELTGNLTGNFSVFKSASRVNPQAVLGCLGVGAKINRELNGG